MLRMLTCYLLIYLAYSLIPPEDRLCAENCDGRCLGHREEPALLPPTLNNPGLVVGCAIIHSVTQHFLGTYCVLRLVQEMLERKEKRHSPPRPSPKGVNLLFIYRTNACSVTKSTTTGQPQTSPATSSVGGLGQVTSFSEPRFPHRQKGDEPVSLHSGHEAGEEGARTLSRVPGAGGPVTPQL